MTSSADIRVERHLFGVLLCAPLLQILLFLLSGVSFETHSRYAFLSGMTMEYAVAAFVFWSVRRVGWSPADIGLSRPEAWLREVLIGLGAGVVFFVVTGAFLIVLAPVLGGERSLQPLPTWAAWTYGLGLLTAFAPIEEIVWRGYALTVLRRRGHGVIVAVAIASVAFGLMHWWGGGALMVAAALMGGLYSALFLWRRNLLAAIVAHFVADFPLFLFMFLPPPSAGR